MYGLNQRVPQGGMYHVHKTKYSPETHNLLRVMMDECKLTFLQKRQLGHSIARGEALPSIKQASSHSAVPQSKVMELKPAASRRRTRDSIQKMGAYEREKFIPKHPRVNKDEEKSKLQNLMAYGKEIPQIPVGQRIWRRKAAELPENIDRFDELIEEVTDRRQFLNEMEALGHGKKYHQLIQAEITMKLKEMQELDIDRFNKLCKYSNI
ncbi:UPF0193 protein EVG1-like [Ischnura elegans]|uniref:UPF0193 protein EVG1-like n=1 Tax=Ischnura elegans TaxID=197161 RepID=UPI001ED86773|nr:UPF0193 protein EVG1-like [Ischnura elegans]